MHDVRAWFTSERVKFGCQGCRSESEFLRRIFFSASCVFFGIGHMRNLSGWRNCAGDGACMDLQA